MMDMGGVAWRMVRWLFARRRAGASCQQAMALGCAVEIASQKPCTTSSIVSACDQAAE
jgi:hypothetical protein